jgi:hypothetical protein
MKYESAGAENENAMEIEYFPCAVLIGLRHGIETPIPWRNVHRTATLRHGARSGFIFFRWRVRRGATRAPNRPLQLQRQTGRHAPGPCLV